MFFGDHCSPRNETAMRLSIRSQLSCTIVEVALGTVMATVKVRLDGGEQVVTASITKDAAVDLQLAEGNRRRC
jgi:molybdopterin-binding protein